MPAKSQYRAVNFSGWRKGLIRQTDPTRLELDALYELENFVIGPAGELELRTGHTIEALATGQDGEFIKGWRRPTDNEDMMFVVVDSGEIFSTDVLGGGSMTSPGGVELSYTDNLQMFGVGIASAYDKLYFSSKGSAAVRSTDGGNGAITYGSPADIPVCKHLLYRHGHMHAINTVANPSRIHISELNTPETFDVADYIDVNPDDGFEINAAAIYGDDLIVFKDRSMWKLTGRSPISYTLYVVDTNRGCVSPRAVAEMRGKLFFFDRDSGVWAFDGAGFELVSDPIKDYLLDSMDYDYAYTASAYVADDRFYLSLRQSDGSTYRTFVYFGDSQSWAIYEGGFLGAHRYLTWQYLGLPGLAVYTVDPDSQELSHQTGDLGGSFRTGWIVVGGSGVQARMRRLEVGMYGNDEASVTIKLYKDYETTAHVTKTLAGSDFSANATFHNKRFAFDGWGDRLHAIQIEVISNAKAYPSVGRTLRVNEMTVFYTGGIDVRGER